MDTNFVLLILSVLMAFATLVQLVRLRPPEVLSHLAAPVIVLGVAGVAHTLQPASAGYIAGAACGLLLLVPAYTAQPVGRALIAQRFKRARAFSWVAAVLNPIAPRFRALRVISLLEAIEAGRVRAADLDARDTSPRMRGVYIHALRSENRYAEIVDYCRSVAAAERDRDLGLLAHEVRALGETGRYEEMIALASAIAHKPSASHVNADVRLIALAFLGQTQLTDHFAALRVGVLSAPVVSLWQATARAAAGDAGATAAFEALASSGHAGVRKGVQHRLAQPLTKLELDALPSARAYIDEVAAEEASSAGLLPGPTRVIATPIVMALLALAFCAQIPGGTTDIENLVALGGLVVPSIEGFDQPWRLLSAAFLHYGATHLVLNLLGLWALGRRIEGALGGFKLALLFIGTAILGNLAARLWMSSLGVVVGASGGVMGLLGALVAIVLYRRRQRRTRYLTGALREVGVIVVMQAAFDFVMPNVGTLVHVAGFVAGVGLGFLLVPTEKRAAL